MSKSAILRPATLEDIPVLFQLIQALAEYEKLSHEVSGNAENLKQHLFGTPSYTAIPAVMRYTKVITKI